MSIQLRRGLKANLPVLVTGELAYCTDTGELFIGQASGGNLKIASGTTYVVELGRWGISNDGTNPTASTTGINNAITWAIGKGYSYVKLPAGIYTVPKGTVDGDKTAALQLQSNVTLDLTGCTVQKETNAYNTSYAVYGKDLVNTIILGGTIKGDRDTHDFSNTGQIYEWNMGVYIEGKNRNVSILGVEVTDFPGYSISFNGYQYNHELITYTNIESGTFDGTGVASVNANYVRTNRSYALAGYTNITAVGSFQITGNGYNSFGSKTDGGSVNLSNTIFNLHCYNSSGTYLNTIQRRCYDSIPLSALPTGTASIKISFRYDYTKIIPGTFYLGLDARQPAIGTRIANCKIHDSYALGITMSNATLTTIENNEVYNMGFALSKIGRNLYPFPMGMDIEDGYNANQHIVIRNNVFRDNQSLHLSLTQVRNIIVENNKFQGTGGITFQGLKGSNAVSRNNDYNLTSGTGQSSTYVKFENDHMSASNIQLSFECTYDNCVFDDMQFQLLADTYADFATGSTYGLGNAVLPSSGKKNGFYYVCTTAPTVSVSTEPTWGTVVGGTTTDVAGNVWTCFTYDPTYELIQFRNCKFRVNQPEVAFGINLRRANILYDNCYFELNTLRYFTDNSASSDFAGKNQFVFKDCDIRVASGSSFGGVSGKRVHVERSRFTGAVDGLYPDQAFAATSLVILDTAFDSYYSALVGYVPTGVTATTTLTMKNSRTNMNKTNRTFGNGTEGFYIRNFDNVIIDNNEFTVAPTSFMPMRPFSLFAEKYLKMVNNTFNSTNTANNIELWGAYRSTSYKSAIPVTSVIANNNVYTKMTVKTDPTYLAQLTKVVGNGFTDLDATTEGSSTSVSAVPTSGYYYLGQLLSNSSPVSGGSVGWVTTRAGIANNTTWAAATAYSANALTFSGTAVYQALTTGRSAGTTPVFPTGGGRVDDVVGVTVWAPNTAYSVGARVVPQLEVSDPVGTPTVSMVPNANSTVSTVMHYILYTWVTATGETKGSSEATITMSAGNNLSVSVPTFPAGVTKANIYVGLATGQCRLQGSINTSGTSYTISSPINIAVIPTPANLAPLTSSNGFFYECTATTGNSGATAPTWSKTANATMSVDGGVTWAVRGIVTWKNIGTLADFRTYGVIS
jgi:hypothetical protein